MSGIQNVTGQDFASELMLNKVMNGQLKPENGNIVTAGLRAKADKLYVEAIDPSVSSANIQAAKSNVINVQDQLTEMKKYITDLKTNLSDTPKDSLATTITDAAAWLGNVATRKVDNKAVFAADGEMSVNMGLNEKLAMDFTGISDLAINLHKALTAEQGVTTNANFDFNATGVKTAYDAFMTGINDALTSTSMNVRSMDTRSTMLNDIASTFVEGGDSQILSGLGGASGLLNNLVG